NYALLVTVRDRDAETLAIYKPRRGERPLWDFPHGTLYLREYAAYLLSEALGWSLVPPTVLREGVYGPGSVQWCIESDPEVHYYTIYPNHADDFRRIALFDIVANNADRKAGHCLLDERGKIWSIDHGICFHAEWKLRTVIWDFAGEPIPAEMLADLQALRRKLASEQGFARALARLLLPEEIEALCQRLEDLIALGHFPHPNPHRRNHPWPPI
ncbi:MAG: SCO1664 family protein, partial [Chloroflexi bacterium]|nr:SCO1664 family protein [Chloroflexota bacterium]